MSQKKPIELPSGITLASNFIRDLHVERANLEALITSVYDQLYEKREQEFIAFGGCETCGGRGWIVTWDTMDSMSGDFAEYGSCTNEACTEESRKASGLHPRRTMYDEKRKVGDPVRSSVAYLELTRPMFDRQREINAKLYLVDDKIVRNCEAIITKGRKHPIGTIGRIEWTGVTRNGWAMSKLIVSSTGEELWVYTNNLEKVLPQM